MSKEYVIDLRLIRDGGLKAVALITDAEGNEIDIITFESLYMHKSGICHSTLDKAAKAVAEHGGKYISLKTNFIPLHKDFSQRRNNFPLTKITRQRLQEYGVTIKDAELINNDPETGLVL